MTNDKFKLIDSDWDSSDSDYEYESNEMPTWYGSLFSVLVIVFIGGPLFLIYKIFDTIKTGTQNIFVYVALAFMIICLVLGLFGVHAHATEQKIRSVEDTDISCKGIKDIEDWKNCVESRLGVLENTWAFVPHCESGMPICGSVGAKKDADKDKASPKECPKDQYFQQCELARIRGHQF